MLTSSPSELKGSIFCECFDVFFLIVGFFEDWRSMFEFVVWVNGVVVQLVVEGLRLRPCADFHPVL